MGEGKSAEEAHGRWLIDHMTRKERADGFRKEMAELATKWRVNPDMLSDLTEVLDEYDRG
jgi:hypothetical protein